MDQYDANAIRVDNVMHHQIGHLPHKVAEKLAPYMVTAPCFPNLAFLTASTDELRILGTSPSRPS